MGDFGPRGRKISGTTTQPVQGGVPQDTGAGKASSPDPVRGKAIGGSRSGAK